MGFPPLDRRDRGVKKMRVNGAERRHIRYMFKRFISMILAVLTVLSLSAAAFALGGPAAAGLSDTPRTAAAGDPSEQEAYERMIALQEVYPDGAPWDSSSYYIDKNGLAEYGCFGFATLLQEAAFPGQTLKKVKRPPITIEDLHVGDLLSYGIGYGAGGHSVVVLEVHSDYIVLAEGNWSNSVNWGRTMSAEEVKSVQYCYTYYSDKSSSHGGWIEKDGERYYYKYSEPVTGWDWIDSAWYIFDDSGKLIHDQWARDSKYWYYMGSDGKMLTGLQKFPEGWYYFNPKNNGSYGRLMDGWVQIDGVWHYFNKSTSGNYGRMVVNDWAMDGKYWFFLDGNGVMMTGLRWIATGSSYDGLYYFSEVHDGYYGRVMDGWQNVNGDWYYFNPKHDGKYGVAYMDGTYTIDGASYTFDAEGKLVGDLAS